MKKKEPTLMPTSPLKGIFRALRHRNFRLFIIGQGISLIGTWVQTTAMGWLVYRLTDSVFLVGLTGFAQQIPSLFFTPITGVIADSYNRRTILLFTQTFSMAQAFLLGALTAAGCIAVWHIIVLSFVLGIINALDMPARQSFFLQMVENRSDLGNAIALNSSIVNIGRLLGPAVGGILIATSGEAVCFLLNGLSYIGVIIALARMRISILKKSRAIIPPMQAFREGVDYAFGFAPIKWILALVGLFGVFGFPYSVFMPVVARDILHGGPHTLGFLLASSGCGALAGALLLASRKGAIGLGDWVVRSSYVFGAALIAFSFSNESIISFVLVLCIGFGMIVQLASCNTLLQTIVDDDKRGRVMSFYTMAFMGVTPIGSLVAGAAADAIGTALTLRIGGLCCLAAAFLFSLKLRSFLKQIHAKIIADGEV